MCFKLNIYKYMCMHRIGINDIQIRIHFAKIAENGNTKEPYL